MRFKPAWSSVSHYTCKSRPCHALIFAHIIPAFGVLRGTLIDPKNATNCYIYAPDSRFGPPPNPPWPPIAPPGLLLCRTPAVQKFSWMSDLGPRAVKLPAFLPAGLDQEN
jgi:hypothetical protein